MDRPQSGEIQLDLIGDYKTNVKLYPKFQEFFRKYQPPTLAVWGKNDPFFIPPGAEAYKRDNSKAKVVFYDTGHFALETHAAEIGHENTEFPQVEPTVTYQARFMANTPRPIPGYTYGEEAVPNSSISLHELDQIKTSVGFTEEDERYLRLAGGSAWRPDATSC